MKYINVSVFIISFAVGIFLAYITLPKPDIIYVYPNPDNIDKIQYKDDAGNCFEFNQKEVTCPNDETKIRKYPIQHINANTNKK